MTRFSLSNQILTDAPQPKDFVKKGKPAWLRMTLPQNEKYFALRKLVKDNNLHTVCSEARCPNIGECWSQGVGTLMILGDTCTRACGFCNIKTGKPPTLDTDEPARVGRAVATMDLNFVCITSVNRDELPDGGASIWAQTITSIKHHAPQTKIEALIPDFCGDWTALQTVIDAQPDILNHNLESVPRLYPAVRPQAQYTRSLELLKRAKQQNLLTKTGIMVGIGETDDEITTLMQTLVDSTQTQNGACDILSIGQYLQPTANHLPVNRFVHPDQFAQYKQIGESLGLRHVESGPMVRSSYHADQQAQLND